MTVLDNDIKENTKRIENEVQDEIRDRKEAVLEEERLRIEGDKRLEGLISDNTVLINDVKLDLNQNYYNKNDIDNQLDDYYNRDEADELLDDTLENYYNKVIVNNLLDMKADKSDTIDVREATIRERLTLFGYKVQDPAELPDDGTYVLKFTRINGNVKNNKLYWSVENNTSEPIVSMVTMTIRLNNGEPDIVLHTSEGTQFERPDDPTKEGYNFINWFTVDDEVYNWDSSAVEDIELFVKWLKIEIEDESWEYKFVMPAATSTFTVSQMNNWGIGHNDYEFDKILFENDFIENKIKLYLYDYDWTGTPNTVPNLLAQESPTVLPIYSNEPMSFFYSDSGKNFYIWNEHGQPNTSANSRYFKLVKSNEVDPPKPTFQEIVDSGHIEIQNGDLVYDVDSKQTQIELPENIEWSHVANNNERIVIFPTTGNQATYIEEDLECNTIELPVDENTEWESLEYEV